MSHYTPIRIINGYTIKIHCYFILPSNRNIRNDLLFFSKSANVSKPSFPGIVPLIFYNKKKHNQLLQDMFEC